VVSKRPVCARCPERRAHRTAAPPASPPGGRAAC
jgi:hypothetical protein